MPIDPNVVAGLRSVQFQAPDPMEQYGKSLTLKNLLMQGDQTQRALDDENAVRDAYKQAGGDSARLRALLQGGGQYKQIQALDKLDLENKAKTAAIGKDDAAAAKSKYDVHIDQIQRRSSILSTATDQASWDAARRVVALQEPEIASQLPAQFDPALLKARLAEGQTLVQRLEDARKTDQNAETGRHNKATEGNAAGTLRVAQDRLAFDKAQPKGTFDTDRGVLVDPRTAKATAVTMDGVPLGPKDKPLTESQGKAYGLAMRAQKAHDILNTLEDEGAKTPSLIKQGVEGVPIIGGGLGMLANKYAASEDQQKVEQAQRDFVNAALRVESGASISESEFQNARKQYFAQPGDTPEAISQKRRNRETEIDSLKVQGGPGGKNVKSTYVQKPPKAADPTKLSDAELRRELGIP